MSYYKRIDGQVRLVRLQTDNFPLFLRKKTDKKNDKFRLHNVQTMNGLRKIAWASVFRLLPFQYIHIRKTELMENGNFRFFDADGKRERQTSVCFLHRKTEVCFP